MITTSASPAYLIDFSAYELSDDDLRSLVGLASLWRAAVDAARGRACSDPALTFFLDLTEALPLEISDPDWQRRWIRAWHDLLGGGYSQVEIMRWYFQFVMSCERTLIGEKESVGRVLLALIATLP